MNRRRNIRSQNDRLLAHMKRRSITTLQATKLDPPILSLHRRLADLEAKGHRIERIEVRNNGKIFKRYRIAA